MGENFLKRDWVLVLIHSLFLSSFVSFLATMVLSAHKLAGRDKGSMWDQLEDAAMETFSISNHLSLCAVFVPPAREGPGLPRRQRGRTSGVERLGFPLPWNL